LQKRSPFDKNVIYHLNTFESMLDYTFQHLAINESTVNYPVLMTEPFCNPNYSRGLVTELMFEAYNVPYLTLGVDFLLSFYYNQVTRKTSEGNAAPLTGLVISSSHWVTHVVPIIEGRMHVNRSKRI
jgi:actin-related protein 5